jgi:hypothetical protein
MGREAACGGGVLESIWAKTDIGGHKLKCRCTSEGDLLLKNDGLNLGEGQ